MKIGLDDLAHIAGEIGLDVEKKKLLIDTAKKIIDQEKEERAAEAEERKKQGTPYVMLLSTGGSSVSETPLFVIKSAAKTPHDKVVGELISAIADHNDKVGSKKGGRKSKIETLGDAFEFLPAKFLKPRGLKILYKEPLIVVQCENNLSERLEAASGALKNDVNT